MQKSKTPRRLVVAVAVGFALAACAAPDGAPPQDGPVGRAVSALSQDVCLGGADTPSLLPQWAQLYTGSALVGSTLISGSVTNTDVIDIPTRIDVRMAGVDARVVSTTLWQGTLKPGAKQVVNLRLDSLPIRSYGVPGVAELVATATAKPRAGDSIYSLPLYAQFDPNKGTFKLTGKVPSPKAYIGTAATYGEAVASLLTAVEPITRRASGGEVLDKGVFVPITKLPPVGDDAFEHGQTMTLAAADSTTLGALFNYNGPSIDDGYARMQVCARYGSAYIDDGKGEAVGGSNLPAAYAQAALGRAGRLPDWSGFLDGGGCTPDLTLLDYTGYTLILGTELQDFPLGGSHKIHIRDAGGSTQTRAIGFSTLSVRRPSWSPRFAIRIGGFGSGDDQSRIAAVLGQALQLPWNSIVPGDYEVRSQRCNNDPAASTACYSPSSQTLFIGPNLDGTHNSQYKFVVAHEFGHAIQDRASGLVNLVYGRDAAINENGPCGCGFVSDPTDRAHCMQSQQRLGATEAESFAHYVAANVWNGSGPGGCEFVYYKNFREDSGAITKPPVTKTCGVPQKWLENHCLTAQRGVEWDWLTFLRTAGVNKAPIPIADVHGVFQQACGGTCSSANEPSFAGLRNAALTYFGGDARDPKFLAFSAGGASAGIDH